MAWIKAQNDTEGNKQAAIGAKEGAHIIYKDKGKIGLGDTKKTLHIQRVETNLGINTNILSTSIMEHRSGWNPIGFKATVAKAAPA